MAGIISVGNGLVFLSEPIDGQKADWLHHVVHI